jgi:hypothetical protein
MSGNNRRPAFLGRRKKIRKLIARFLRALA